MLEQGGAGRGAEFPFQIPGAPGNPLEQDGGGRGGHRQNAVGAVYGAAACHYGRGQDTVRTQLVQQQADSDDICHCVQAAHLMEVDLLHRGPMDLGLRLCQQLVYGQRLLLDPVRDSQCADQVGEMAQIVMRMMMVIPAALGLLQGAVNENGHVGAVDAALGLGGLFQPDPGQADLVKPVQPLLGIWQQFQQRSQQHVAGTTHVAFQIKCFHRPNPSQAAHCQLSSVL